MSSTLTAEDFETIQNLIAHAINERPSQDPYPAAAPYERSSMERGSPEFAEDRTQVNSLNNKFLFDSHLTLSLTAQQRSQANFDQLQAISTRALNASVDLSEKLNARTLANLDQCAVDLAAGNSQRARHADDNAYVTRYDLSNPVATGAGDTLTGAAYTPNRAADTAAAGVAAGVTESVQTNVTAQVAEMVTQVGALTTMVNNLAGSVTANVQAMVTSNALLAAAIGNAIAPSAK